MWLFISISFMIIGNLIRLKRWKSFIKIYEYPSNRYLLFTLGIANIINLLIPFKLGDIIRGVILGKHLKNGFHLAFATVILDRYLDIIVFCFLCLIILVFSYNAIIFNLLIYYMLISISLVIISFFAIYFSESTKKAIHLFSSIFNPKLEKNILLISWNCIDLFKIIWKNWSKSKKFFLLISTILMWASYLISYYTFYIFWFNKGYINLDWYSLIDIFFTNRNFFNSIVLYMNFLNISNLYDYILLISYIVIPILFLFILMPFFRKKHINNSNKSHNTLLHTSDSEQYSFLRSYFSAKETLYFRKYLNINKDIKIIKDLSAGSNAKTILCISNKQKIIRKYTIEKDVDKLHEQVLWIKKYQDILNLPKILIYEFKNGAFYYDMEYSADVVSLFDYIHSNKEEKSWKILSDVLETLNNTLYKNITASRPNNVIEYINSKVIKNLENIKSYINIKNLLLYDNLMINDKLYKNLPQLEKYLSLEYLQSVFQYDKYSDIHGDLTVENILYNYKKDEYLIIDPNGGNIHNSKFLDYAKLLQSLQGGYEFLMKTEEINIDKNTIIYENKYSLKYFYLYKEYKNYLYSNFEEKELRSIMFHHLIHWLRLLPYKLEKLDNTAIIFYSEFIILLNEITDEFGNEKASNI